MATVVSFSRIGAELQKTLKANVLPQFKIASTVALTRTAVAVRNDLKADMSRIFDRPTPWALNSLKAVPATKTQPFSKIALKDFGGTPAEKYLGPEIIGGARPLKRFEYDLKQAGILPIGDRVVPGKAASIDQYGNQKKSEIIQILSALRAFPEVGYLANRSRKLRAKASKRQQAKYFVAKSKIPPHQPIGIWKVLGPGRVAPVMVFVKVPRYKPRFPFFQLAGEHARQHFETEMLKALTEAMQSRRGWLYRKANPNNLKWDK